MSAFVPTEGTEAVVDLIYENFEHLSPLASHSTALVLFHRDEGSMPAYDGTPQAYACSHHVHVNVSLVYSEDIEQWVEWCEQLNDDASLAPQYLTGWCVYTADALK